MPYEHEFAAADGFQALLTDDFLQARLRTFSFTPPTAAKEEAIDFLAVKNVQDLPSAAAADTLTHAVSIDGSLAHLEDENYSLAAIKIAAVVQNLKQKRKLQALPHLLTQENFASLYKQEIFTALMPGEGIFAKAGVEDLWQDKFREELHANLQHMHLPWVQEFTSLLKVLEAVTPQNIQTHCVACARAHRVSKADNVIALNDVAYCKTCLRDAYFSDFLFTEAWTTSMGGKSKDHFGHTMLIMEKLLFHGMLMAAAQGKSHLPPASTIFVLDGPLAIYSFTALNQYFKDSFAKMPFLPLAMGVEKTGIHANFAATEKVQKMLKPGSIAMVTHEASQLLAGRAPSATAPASIAFGKRFLYRTQDGAKTFVFMALTPSNFNEDAWETYPSLATYCDFIEHNATDRFGLTTAALDVIAEANASASLPKNLSQQALTTLVAGVQ